MKMKKIISSHKMRNLKNCLQKKLAETSFVLATQEKSINIAMDHFKKYIIIINTKTITRYI